MGDGKGLRPLSFFTFMERKKQQMMKAVQGLHPVIFILMATIFEASGDAIVRMAIFKYSGLIRIGIMLMGAIFLFMYGFLLNLAPVAFGQVVGLYIATLFVVWQVINFIAFQALPNLPTMVGGLFIIAGGLIITFWKYCCLFKELPWPV